MRVTTKQALPAFQPVTITIVVETQQELDALYAIGNCSMEASNAIALCKASGASTTGEDVDTVTSVLWRALDDVYTR